MKTGSANWLDGVHFRYRMSGPYSRELSGALSQAIAGGLVEEQESGYVLTSQGRSFRKDLPVRAAPWHMVRSPSVSTLRAAATAVFFEVRKNSDHPLDEAMRRQKGDRTSAKEVLNLHSIRR